MNVNEAAKLKSNIFATIELDTNVLTSQITIVRPTQSQARYSGTIKSADEPSKFSPKVFTLAVIAAPAADAVTIDLTGNWSTSPTFEVVEIKGFVVLQVADDSEGGRTVRIKNSAGVFFDNTQLKGNDQVIFRLLRPGVHEVVDQLGGGKCDITVDYPLPPIPPSPPWPTKPVTIQVTQPDPKKPTEMNPNKITISPLQPVVFQLGSEIASGTRLVSNLLAVTDRFDNEFKKVLTHKGRARNLKI